MQLFICLLTKPLPLVLYHMAGKQRLAGVHIGLNRMIFVIKHENRYWYQMSKCIIELLTWSGNLEIDAL